MSNEDKLYNLAGVSELLRLPPSWIKKQVSAGKIPCLRVGRRMLFNIDAVREALADLAMEGADDVQRS